LTGRLRIRPYRADDLDSVMSIFGRADVSRYLNWEPMDREAATALLERRLKQTRIEHEGEGLGLVVAERETDRFVGEVVLRLMSEASRQGEIGWSIHPDAQARGYATEAAREMLRLGFEELGLHRIVAECDPRNEASPPRGYLSQGRVGRLDGLRDSRVGVARGLGPAERKPAG